MKLFNGVFSVLLAISIVAPAMAETISAPRAGWPNRNPNPPSQTTSQSVSQADQPVPQPVAMQPTKPQVVGVYAPRAGVFPHVQ